MHLEIVPVTIAPEALNTRYVLPDYPPGLDKRAPLDGGSPYGRSRLAAHQYIRDYSPCMT